MSDHNMLYENALSQIEEQDIEIKHLRAEIDRLTSELEQARLDNQSLAKQHNELAVKLQVMENAWEMLS